MQKNIIRKGTTPRMKINQNIDVKLLLYNSTTSVQEFSYKSIKYMNVQSRHSK